MLQKLVDQGVLLLTDDSHFDKLKKSAAELTKRLEKNKSKTLAFVYTALDSKASAGSAEIAEVQAIITKGWTTFSSTAKDSAVGYIRAVILESLETVSKDESFASLVWLASRHILQYHTLIASEKQVVVDFLSNISSSLQAKAESDWSIGRSAELSGFKSEISFIAIDKARIESFLKSASAPTDQGGNNPVVAADPTWPNYFSKRAAQGISEEIAKSVKSATTEIVANQKRLLDYFNANIRIQDIRSKLLWWKEAGYSYSAGRRYRDLESGVLELVLPVDYATFLPILTPVSVDYFLLNVYESYDKAESKDHSVSIVDFLAKISASKEMLKAFLPDKEPIGSRMSLLDFITGMIWDKYDVTQFSNFTGLDGSQKVKRTDLVLWLFNDKQVVKLINS